MLNEEEQKYLLNIARKTLENKELDLGNIPEKLKEKRACFVTLNINGQLRGCIGSIEARQELYKDVIENTINASKYDSRFGPVSKEEISKIKIEISVLTPLQKTSFKDIKPFEDGVMIKKGFKSALFLPQVWEELPSEEEFFSNLCMKAGLESDAWKSDLEYYKFQVENFEE